MKVTAQKSEWVSERVNGGVTGVGNWHFSREDGKEIDNCWLEAVGRKWDLRGLFAGRMEDTGERNYYGPGVVGWFKATVEVGAEWEEVFALFDAHEAACAEVAVRVTIPPSWRRWDFIGKSVEEMVVSAEAYWNARGGVESLPASYRYLGGGWAA